MEWWYDVEGMYRELEKFSTKFSCEFGAIFAQMTQRQLSPRDRELKDVAKNGPNT